MQRGNAQVASFRKCDRRFHRFSIPYFADEDHVRGLPQRVLQRVLEVHGVESDFALRDDRLFVLMDKLNRVLHRDDVALMGRIPIVDHGGQRGGFTGACGADDQYQPAFGHRDVVDDGRKLKLLDGLNFRFDMAEDESDIASLSENIDAEPAQFLVVKGQIHLHLFFEFPALLASHQSQGQRFQLFVIEGGIGRICCAVDTVDRWRVNRQVEI